MIGLDTNVLLRALLDDEPVQSPIARGVIRSLNAERPGFVSLVVLLELSWTLRTRYKQSSDAIKATLLNLLRNKHFVIEGRELVNAALQQNHLEFADALLRAAAITAGCTRTLTFDAKALRDPHFEPAGA